VDDATQPKQRTVNRERFLLAQAEPPSAEDLPPIERIMVAFAGQGAGAGALSWGQVGLWDAMRRQRSWLPIGAVTSLPPGTSVADMVEELRFMMGRFPTLRTRLRFEPDEVMQVVSATGEVPLDVVDAPAGANPSEVADQILRYYSETDYDALGDWPIRVAVIRHRGALVHRVVVLCHLATDAFGASIMASEVAERRAGEPATATGPLDQARWQGSPAGQRQNSAGLRYCERVLRTASARRFPEPAEKPSPRYWFGMFSSPALYMAVRAIADRAQQDPATVLLAMFAIAHVRVTRLDPMMTMVLVNNRFRPGLSDTVSPITNAVPFAISASGSVDEVVAQTRGRTMAAYKHGYYDPLQFNRLVGRLSRERGEEIDTACYYNDRRMAHRELPAGQPPSAGELAAALSRTSFEWKLKQDKEAYEHFFLHVEDVPDAIVMSMTIDTHQVSPADVEAILRGMEQVAVPAMTNPQAPAR
jgi:condensation domain-containing protein